MSKRADELAHGDRVAVSATSVLTVDDTRSDLPGQVQIRWAGSDLWVIVKADRMFDLAEEVTT